MVQEIEVIDPMSMIQKTDGLLQQLEILTTDEIDLVIAFVEFLQYKKSVQPRDQVNHDFDSIAQSKPQSKVWEQWFAEVDRLEVSLTPASSEYEEGLLAKYKQQGLEL